MCLCFPVRVCVCEFACVCWWPEGMEGIPCSLVRRREDLGGGDRWPTVKARRKRCNKFYTTSTFHTRNVCVMSLCVLWLCFMVMWNLFLWWAMQTMGTLFFVSEWVCLSKTERVYIYGVKRGHVPFSSLLLNWQRKLHSVFWCLSAVRRHRNKNTQTKKQNKTQTQLSKTQTQQQVS